LVEINNSSNPKLLIPNLQNIYNNSFSHQESLNTLVAPYSIAVDNRENVITIISKKNNKTSQSIQS
jgi:hypothetical protein